MCVCVCVSLCPCILYPVSVSCVLFLCLHILYTPTIDDWDHRGRQLESLTLLFRAAPHFLQCVLFFKGCVPTHSGRTPCAISSASSSTPDSRSGLQRLFLCQCLCLDAPSHFVESLPEQGVTGHGREALVGIGHADHGLPGQEGKDPRPDLLWHGQGPCRGHGAGGAFRSRGGHG